MPGPSEQVDSIFALAGSYATANQSTLNSFLAQMTNRLYTPPSLTVGWQSFAAPQLDPMPPVPELPEIEFRDPGNLPGHTNYDLPELQISPTDEVGDAPNIVDMPVPIMSYGVAPTVPSLREVNLPDAPVVNLPDLPAMLSLAAVPLQQVDLREDWLSRLENIPELEIVEPTSYTYARGPQYASALLDQLKGTLARRLQGGTGLDPAVEQAIWDRSRDREAQLAVAKEREVMRQSEAMGFALPSGVLAEQLRQTRVEYYDKLSSLSRDISIKQAEMEQENLKDSIAQGMQLESTLIDYSHKMEQLTFEASKVAADNAITLYNAQVTRFQALLEGYKTYAGAYQTIMQAELSKVEVYKARLQGEQTKADINKSLVETYKAQVDARMANVEIYKAQVNAAQTLVELEKARVGAAGEQIRAYVAQVNAETSKIEAYKASMEAQSSRAIVYKSKVDAYAAKVGAQAEYARVQIARYTALTQAKSAEWDGYRARVGVETERIRALGLQSSAKLDGYKAVAAATATKAEMTSRMWESQIKQYDASVNYTLQVQKINADNLLQTQNARLDAAKVASQVYAQLTASAYGMMNASAGISASASDSRSQSGSVSFSYDGEVTSQVSPITNSRGV